MGNLAEQEDTAITKREFESLKDSVQVSEQENGLIEVRTLMNRKQLELMKALLFDDNYDNVDEVQSKLFEFGSTVHSTDYVGRRIFICLFHMVQGMKQQKLTASVH